MSLLDPQHAPFAPPPTQKLAGITSLVLGLLAAIPLGSFLGAQVAAAGATSVSSTILWGTVAVSLRWIALIGGVPVALLAIAFGLAALVRNGRVGKGCGMAGFLFGGVVLVWLGIAVL